MSSTRRPVWLLVVVLVAIAVGIVWYLRRAPSGAAATAPAVQERAASPPAVATGMGRSTERLAPQDAAGSTQRSDARARRDALREQIARQLGLPPSRGPAPSSTGTAAPAGSDAPPSGGLRNRLGSRQVLVDQLNHDFMPLADECIEQARARSPQLAGMLAIGVETLADDQLGAVVDVADPAPSNQVVDPLLFECIRESAFSLSLPPPPTGGREKFEITMPIDAGSGSGGRP